MKYNAKNTRKLTPQRRVGKAQVLPALRAKVSKNPKKIFGFNKRVVRKKVQVTRAAAIRKRKALILVLRAKNKKKVGKAKKVRRTSTHPLLKGFRCKKVKIKKPARQIFARLLLNGLKFKRAGVKKMTHLLRQTATIRAVSALKTSRTLQEKQLLLRLSYVIPTYRLRSRLLGRPNRRRLFREEVTQQKNENKDRHIAALGIYINRRKKVAR